LDLAHLDQLAAAIRSVKDAAILVLQADEGCRCFSAGNAIQDHVPDRAPEMLRHFHTAIRALLDTSAVTVADVRGDALGGGCELVTACDLVYATPEARFGQPEIRVGCYPPAAAALLPRRVGWTRAVEMITTGRLLDANEAVEFGLVTRVSASGADEAVASLLDQSPAVLRLAKRAMQSADLDEAERLYRDELLQLPDCTEGVLAFLEKRPPRWTD
jgi:cyclohexa-1,5-dienecarbonyl-CoA hydratase